MGHNGPMLSKVATFEFFSIIDNQNFKMPSQSGSHHAPHGATRSLVTAPAVVRSAWERQTAGAAAADTAQQDQTTCSHDLLQLSDTDRPTNV